MYSKDRYKSSIAFVDLLFNILVGFVFLFLVAFLLINPVSKKADIEKKAEFIVHLTWPDESADDIDLWVMGPNGDKIGFNNKESGVINLERDDLGQSNDIMMINGKSVIIKKNEEVIAIRGIMPGTYHISVHFYNKFRVPGDAVPITVTLLKLNPYREIHSERKIIKREGEIVNFIRFEVHESGNVQYVEPSRQSAVGNHGKNYASGGVGDK